MSTDACERCDQTATQLAVYNAIDGSGRLGTEKLCDDCAAFPFQTRMPPKESGRVTACKSCGAPIRWQQTKGGKPTPIDESGEPHWASCPQAELWRK